MPWNLSRLWSHRYEGRQGLPQSRSLDSGTASNDLVVLQLHVGRRPVSMDILVVPLHAIELIRSAFSDCFVDDDLHLLSCNNFHPTTAQQTRVRFKRLCYLCSFVEGQHELRPANRRINRLHRHPPRKRGQPFSHNLNKEIHMKHFKALTTLLVQPHSALLLMPTNTINHCAI